MRTQISRRVAQTFDDVLLEHFYHAVLTFVTFPERQFGQLVSAYEPSRWNSNDLLPLVAAVYRERLAQWARRETNEGRRWLIAQWQDKPGQTRSQWYAYQVLRRYPSSVGQKVLGAMTWKALEEARLAPAAEGIPDDAIDEARTEIRYFLNSRTAELASLADLKHLLDAFSGQLLDEFSAVERALDAHPDWATSDLVGRIERLFTPIRSGLVTRMARLHRLLPPAYPSAPDSDWPVEAWLSWARDEYMPYRAWSEAQGRDDTQIARYAEQFADWYYQNFAMLRNTAEEHFAYAALYKTVRKLRQSQSVGLIVLLDNFNYARFDRLVRIFGQQGFSLTAEYPVLSLIPTATEVGKASLIATQGDRVEVSQASYASLAQKEWPTVLGAGKTVQYLPDVGMLQALAERSHDLYILNYLAVDNALHEPSRITGVDHNDTIVGLLRALVTAIAEFMRRFQLEQRLQVFIVSDHGSTRIARGVVNAVDHELFKDVADIRHHRYLALPDDKFRALPQVAETQCYLLDRQRFKTVSNYLIARSYYRFEQPDGDVYVHGGLTPEEVIVPMAHFEPKPLAIVPPTFRLLDSQYRIAVKSSLRFEVGNPNTYAIENVRVSIVGAEGEFTVDSIRPSSTITGSILHTFKRDSAGSGLGWCR